MTIDTDIRILPNGLEFDEARREARRAYELDRKHVFHSWSAQAADQPDGDHRGRGFLRLGRRRQPAAGLLLPAGEHQHRPPAPEGRRRDPGPGRQAVHRRAAARQRRPLGGGAADRGDHPRRPEQGVLHQRRRRRQRARGPDGPAAHRPLQGAVALPLVPRRHRHRDQRDRRPAPLAERLRQQRRRALLRPVPVPQPVPRRHRGRGVRSARSNTSSRRSCSRGRARSPRSCSKRSPAPPAS